jgi:S-DNA-T family DNA segregation ATPase FtsK/SpoIIIE
MPEESIEPIITDVYQALGTLKSCEKEMELRYDLLSDAQVRSLKEYNARFREGRLGGEHRHLPYIVVVVDELADLMMTAGKDIEGPIARLAQMARAVGIHLILATQRPSVDVITGLIKANFPARIAYQVASKIDSRTILDQNGAQGLVGNGDLLYMLGSNIVRLQGPFVSVDEVERLTLFIEKQRGEGPYILPSIEDPSENGLGSGTYASGDRDELFADAARVIVRSQQGSVSLLQRKLSVGYSRAARIVDQLEDAGIVGPFEGSKARQVLVADELELDQLLSSDTADTP